MTACFRMTQTCYIVVVELSTTTEQRTGDLCFVLVFSRFGVLKTGAAGRVSPVDFTAPPHVSDHLLAHTLHVLISCRMWKELVRYPHRLKAKTTSEAPCKHFWMAHACF